MSGGYAVPACTQDGVVRVRDGPSARRPWVNPPELAGFSFHFRSGLDNSGFVGWLATRLKARLGTGVFVVCGQNSARGGIFDYWGFPTDLRHDAIMLLAELRRGDGEDHA